jgi:hypothetical protein
MAVYMGLNLIPTDNLARLVVIDDFDLIIKGLRRVIKKADPILQ